MNITLAKKQILITGGTSALGCAIVRRAAEEGATVFFTFHQNTDAAKELEGLGAKGFQIDLTKRSQIDQLRKDLLGTTKALDAIVHNAGIVRDRTIQKMTGEEWDEVLAVNLDAIYYMSKRFLSFLFKRPGSRIINVISRVALRGGFGEANYAAAKAGLIALTKSLAREIGKKQILVNALNPGFMRSAMTQDLPDTVFQKNVDSSALKSISDPEAVSDFVVYLLSDRFRGVSGQVFHFDSRGIDW